MIFTKAVICWIRLFKTGIETRAYLCEVYLCKNTDRVATWCYCFTRCLEITLVVYEVMVAVDYASNLFQTNNRKIKLLILNLCFDCMSIETGAYLGIEPSASFLTLHFHTKTNKY